MRKLTTLLLLLVAGVALGQDTIAIKFENTGNLEVETFVVYSDTSKLRLMTVDFDKVKIIGAPCWGCCVAVIYGYKLYNYGTKETRYFDRLGQPLSEEWIVWDTKDY